MSNEDRIDEIIRTAASDYNRPPVVPREEMWNAIQAGRASDVRRLHVVAGSTASSRSAESFKRSFPPRFAWIGVAAAAAFLIATGIGIGRWTTAGRTPLTRNNPVEVIAETPIASPAPSVVAEKAPAQAQSGVRSREDIRRNPVVVGTGRLRPLSSSHSASTVSFDRVASGSTAAIYQIATVRHLADAEALLTSFSVGSHDPAMNAQFADWAKGLLSNTRLLLDSPAGDDPRRAKLLQDLELVLAQIVQLAPDARAEDRELIKGSIQQEHVMTRLRTAIPAGQPKGILEK